MKIKFMRSEYNLKHSKRSALFFSLMPGAGHMYLGLFRQGIQLMLLFMSLIFIAGSFEMDFLMVFTPIIWFYSIFDVRSKCEREELLVDGDLPFFSDLTSIKYFSDNHSVEKYIAYILILMGAFSAINNFIIPLLSRYIDYYYIRTGKSIIVSFVLIAIGVYMLKGRNLKVKSGDETCNQDE